MKKAFEGKMRMTAAVVSGILMMISTALLNNEDGIFLSSFISGFVAIFVGSWVYNKWGVKYIKPTNKHQISLGVALSHAAFSVAFGLAVLLLLALGITMLTEPSVTAAIAPILGSIAFSALLISAAFASALLYIACRIAYIINERGGRKR